MKALITCFEDFSNIQENSSRLAVEALGLPYQILPVSFERCDQTLPKDLDLIIQVGVAASRENISIERYGHNLAHSPGQSDNDQVSPIQQRLIKEGPAAIETNVSIDIIDSITGNWTWSLSAGSYVCNALYFKTLYRMPQTKSLFIHIPYHLSSPSPQQSLEDSRNFLLNVWNKLCLN